MKRLEGKVAIITGGTSGIGERIAEKFAEESAIVIITGRNSERGKLVQDNIRKNGGNAEFIVCDLTQEEDIINLKDIVVKRYGKLDILVNNSGVFLTAPLEQSSIEDWDLSFNVNVTGCYLITKHFISLLCSNKGVILNNASIAGMQSYANGNSYMYSASKAALIQFTHVLAKNYAKDIRANCICPGIIDTPIYTNRDFSRFNDRIPMGRVGNPEDVAKAALFLVSEDSAYITGAVLPVDGGASL